MQKETFGGNGFSKEGTLVSASPVSPSWVIVSDKLDLSGMIVSDKMDQSGVTASDKMDQSG